MSFLVPVPGAQLSRDIADFPEGIVIPVNKPLRWTSADVIRKLKFAAIKHFGKKNLKVGHAGTLDPLATGILLVCIGPACRMAQSLQDTDKEYIALMRFGATTPSYDLEKPVDRMFPHEHITEEAVRAALPAFLGEQEQVAPLFSAKSVDGVRAYELARKLYRSGSGNLDTAALETLHRSRITISELELLGYLEASFSEEVDSPETVPPAAHEWEGPIGGREWGKACFHTGPDDNGRDEDRRSEVSGESATSEKSTASSRIHFEDTSALGLPEATIRIACSKGTYIRAFARDLGEALGSGAHLAGLIRSRSGSFRLSDALTMDQAMELFR